MLNKNTPQRRPLGALLLVSLALPLAACRLNVQPLPDTPVVSESGSYLCENNQDCKIDIVDTTFDETFLAVAPLNWAFTGWAEGENYLCPGSMQACRVNSGAAAFSPVFEDILESDERYFLAPTIDRHFRRLLEGPYTGKQLERGREVAARTLFVEISANENRVDLRPNFDGSRPGCFYEGQFTWREVIGRSALEGFEGTYSCNLLPLENGTFTGQLYRPGHATLFVEIEQTSQEEVTRNLSMAMVRDSEGSQQAPLIDCCIARVTGRNFNARSAGVYSGGAAQLSTTQCSILQETRARSSFLFALDDEGRWTIEHNHEERPDCSYQQDDSGMLQGSYSCDDGDTGVWGSAELKRYGTRAGQLFDLSFIQSPDTGCGFEMNFYGVRAN